MTFTSSAASAYAGFELSSSVLAASLATSVAPAVAAAILKNERLVKLESSMHVPFHLVLVRAASYLRAAVMARDGAAPDAARFRERLRSSASPPCTLRRPGKAGQSHEFIDFRRNTRRGALPDASVKRYEMTFCLMGGLLHPLCARAARRWRAGARPETGSADALAEAAAEGAPVSAPRPFPAPGPRGPAQGRSGWAPGAPRPRRARRGCDAPACPSATLSRRGPSGTSTR